MILNLFPSYNKINMRLIFVIFLKLSFFWATYVQAACPAAFKILPCKCETKMDGPLLKSFVTCERVENEEELANALLPTRKEKIHKVQIKASSFMFFPDGLFDGNGVEVLEIYNSSIFSLGERNPAFFGLESNLEKLDIFECSFVNNWNWTELRNMKFLRHLTISGSQLLDLPDVNISHLPIEVLNFRDNYISHLPGQVFNTFTQLKRLTLSNNNIQSIMRSAFPLPAKYLEAIDLSHNRIRSLQINMFEKMPALKFLYLGGNPLRTLSEETFKPVWTQLKMALFQDCQLNCNCYMLWITETKRPIDSLIGGTCYSPMQLKDKRLTQLLPKHFPNCL